MTQKFKVLKLEEAKRLAEKWVKKLGECCCNRIDVVAGVYREKPETSDVDLLCQPKDMKLLRALGPVKEDRIRIVFNDEGRKVEVWKSSPDEYELLKWYRRLEAKDFIQLASRAKEKAMKLSWREGLIKDGKVLTKDPEEIEEALT